MALANESQHFIAPQNIRDMAQDLAPLMEFVESEGIMVWGWDKAIKKRLLRMGVSEEMLPTDAALATLRTCSERASAYHLLRTFHASHPNGPYIGESILAHNTSEITHYAAQHEHIILKDPLSSSGKGLRHITHSTEPGKTVNWANALINRHGYFTAEPYYDKIQDFAMEFHVSNEQCKFIGYSLFTTNHHGRYESNLLISDEKIESVLALYIPHSTLHEVKTWFVEHHNDIIPKEWNTTLHPLHFGIDMMIVATSDEGKASRNNCQMQNAYRQFKLHPCVEINLRLNMGIIAHEVRRKLLAPGIEGTFHITSFPSEEAALKFYATHKAQYPSTYKDGKIISGYHPLTPIHQHTRHHAYIISRFMPGL